MAEKTVRARITGRVQGVCFRAWTRDEAKARGMRGWVRNCADGSVAALFSGPARAVEEMLGQCRVGPAAARVDSVETVDADEEIALSDFEIRY